MSEVHSGEFYNQFNQMSDFSASAATFAGATAIPIEQMSPQYIQTELENGLKIVRNQVNKDGNIPPPIDLLENNYTDFIENKAYSFLLYSYHPYFKNKFEQNDIKEINKATRTRGQAVSYLNISSILAIYAGCEHLFKTRPIFGLTTNTGIAALFFRYYLVPKLLTSIVDYSVFYPQLQRKTSVILRKYNFESELQTNPLYKKAFDDLKLYQNNLQIARQQAKQQQ